MPANLCVTVAAPRSRPCPSPGRGPWAAGERGAARNAPVQRPRAQEVRLPDPSNPPWIGPLRPGPGVGGGLGAGREGGREEGRGGRGRQLISPLEEPGRLKDGGEVTGRGGPPARNNGGHRRPGRVGARGTGERGGREGRARRWTRGLARPEGTECGERCGALDRRRSPARPPARTPRPARPLTSRGALSAPCSSLSSPRPPISWRPPATPSPPARAPSSRSPRPRHPGPPPRPLTSGRRGRGLWAVDAPNRLWAPRRAATSSWAGGGASGLSPAGPGRGRAAGGEPRARPPSLPPRLGPRPPGPPGRLALLSACRARRLRFG